MHTKSPLTFKLLAMGAGFLLVALASIGLTLWWHGNSKGVQRPSTRPGACV